MFVLFCITFMDLLGFGLIFPLLPMFQDKFGITPLEIGIMVSLFSILTLVGNLVFGILSDRMGRKIMLVIPTLGMGISYLFTPLATTYTTLLLVRSLTGFFSGNFSVCFAAACDLSSKENRAKVMGMMSAFFGLGFMFGPAIGGYLVFVDFNHTFHIPFIVAGVCAVLAGLFALCFFKESLPKATNEEATTNILAQLKNIVQNKLMLANFAFATLLILTLSGFEVYFSIWLNMGFKLNSLQIGIFWTIFAVAYTIAQFTIPRFFSGIKPLYIGMLMYVLTFLLMAMFTKNITVTLILALLIAIIDALLFPNINSNISLESSPRQQGLVFGIVEAATSIGRIIGPYILGLVFTYSNIATLWLTTAFFAFIMLFFVKNLFNRQSLT